MFVGEGAAIRLSMVLQKRMHASLLNLHASHSSPGVENITDPLPQDGEDEFIDDDDQDEDEAEDDSNPLNPLKRGFVVFVAVSS